MNNKVKFGWYRLAGTNILIYSFNGKSYSYYDTRYECIRDFDNVQIIIQALHPITLPVKEIETIILGIEQKINEYQGTLKETKSILKRVKKYVK